MSRTHFSITVGIPAAPSQVWAVISDVEAWPEWTASILRVKWLSPGPMQIGSRVRIAQPKLPAAIWRVTELNPGRGFTWVSVAPGLRVTAGHTVNAIPTGSRVTLSIQYEGIVGRLLARLTYKLNELYLAMEANGLKARCTNAPASHIHEQQNESH